MAIEVSIEGIIQASEKILSYSKELSNLFDDLEQIKLSLSSNLTDSIQFNQILDELNEVISSKDYVITKIDKIGNYLTNTVVPGYDTFMNLIGTSVVDITFLNNLQILLESKTKLLSKDINLKKINTKYLKGGK